MKVFNSLFIYTLSNLFLFSVQLLFQLFALKELNETEYGIYSSALLFSSYILFFGLGLQTNLAVKISRSGDFKMADEHVNSTLTYFLLVLIFGFVSIFLFHYFFGKELNRIFLFLVFLMSLKGLIIQKFFIVIMRTSRQIQVLSYSQLFIAVVSLFQIVLFKHLGLVFIKNLLMVESLISIVLYSSFCDVKLGLNFTSILIVLKDGVKFWKVNFLFSMFPVVVTTIALRAFSLEDFGYFSIFYIGINMFAKLTASVDKINYIDITKNYSHLYKVKPVIIFRKNLLYVAFFYTLLLVIFLLFGESIVLIVLPEKINVIPILFLSIVTSAIGIFNYLNVYFDVLEEFNLKYINIVVKFIVMFLLVSIFIFVEEFTIMNLCITVFLSEFSAVLVNLVMMRRFRPLFKGEING